MRSASPVLLSATAISGTGTVLSSAADVSFSEGFSVVLTVTGTATGTAKLQGSIDGAAWVDLPNSGATVNIAISGAASHLWNVAGAYYAHVRVSYTNATNTGTLAVRACMKGAS